MTSRPERGEAPEAAWTPFVDGLRAFVARRVPAQDAEDVAQEALLRIHRDLPRLQDPRRLQSWVFAVARHTVADFFRRRDPAETGDQEPLETLKDPGSQGFEKLASYDGDHSVHEEVLTWLRPLAESLPATYRSALLLADFEGVTQKEVADRLGLSVPGAKSRVQRARRLLARELERCCSVELDAEGRAEDFRRNLCDC